MMDFIYKFNYKYYAVFFDIRDLVGTDLFWKSIISMTFVVIETDMIFTNSIRKE